jgi:uncharacterized membrane protein
MYLRLEVQPPPRQDQNETPTLSRAIDRYVRTIVRLRLKASSERSPQERIADAITGFAGRLLFVVLHIVWFAAWILVNTGTVGIRPFDPLPYGLLTMVVSLEAIFLSTFVLISQNRLSQQAEHRADLDLHIDLLTEYELTRVLRMLDAIQDKMGIDNEKDRELAELEMGSKPERVFAEIERLQSRVLRTTRRRRPART